MGLIGISIVALIVVIIGLVTIFVMDKVSIKKKKVYEEDEWDNWNSDNQI